MAVSRDATLVNYRLERKWVPFRDELIGYLRDDLSSSPHVVLVAYSMGACAAVDVLEGAALDEESLARLSLVLVAPAARVKRPWSALVPAATWAERWKIGSTYLRERRNEGGKAWEEFFDRRIRLLYSHDDLFVMPEGFHDLEHMLPELSKATVPGINHVGWLRAHRLEDTVDALLRASRGIK